MQFPHTAKAYSIKYINIQHYFIRNKVTNKYIKLTFINTSNIVANDFTKPLSLIKFNQFLALTGLYPAKGQYKERTLG